MKSMCVNLVFVGVISYADRVVCDESDPLTILMNQEENVLNDSLYPDSSVHCWPLVRSVEEL